MTAITRNCIFLRPVSRCTVMVTFHFCALKKQPMMSFYLSLYSIFVKLLACSRHLTVLKRETSFNVVEGFLPRTSVGQSFKLKFLRVFLRTITVQQHEI